MLTYRWFALAAVLALVPVATSEDKKPERKDEKKAEFKLTDEEQAVIDLTNAERKKDNLPPLKMNPALVEAARAHAKNMAEQEKLEHVLDGKDPVDRAKAAGYKSGFVGENIAWGQKTPKEVVQTWMDSEGHRKNILDKDFKEIGVAASRTSKGVIYWVQVFGSP